MEEKIPLEMLNEIIRPTTVKRIGGQGLPMPKDPTKRRDLLVSFDIKFPDHLAQSVKDILNDTLPNWNFFFFFFYGDVLPQNYY